MRGYHCIGAIIGDIVGSPYEFDNIKTDDFPLFIRRSYATDDSVMTLAIADALVEAADGTDDEITAVLIRSMLEWGFAYPGAGYGSRFQNWFYDPKPYGSYGNGSAMRVSPVGWLYDTLERTTHVARLTAAVSHDHLEGIKGAQATAAAIFLTRNGMTKDDLRAHISAEYGYDLSRTTDEIRPTYKFTETCMETVPEAITTYLDADSFECTLRKGVSLGGDSDTLTAIAASIAEAKYGVPDEIADGAARYLDEKMTQAISRFQSFLGTRK